MPGVKGDASPYNGNLSYWVGRNSKLYSGPTVDAIKRQKGKCLHCNRLFMEIDGPVELHHIDGNHNNWKRKNLVALHRPCHQAQSVHRKRIREGLKLKTDSKNGNGSKAKRAVKA